MYNIRVKNYLYSLVFYLFCKRKFQYLGKNTRVIFPLNIEGMKNIFIGDNVRIGYKTWLASIPIKENEKSTLVVGEGTFIGNFNHIFCTKKIIIGDKVLTADKVYISDNLHSYKNINIPIIDQPIKQIKCVKIGNGAWIGENVSIIGASIGKNCIIGANSVVTKDIPDYCVAVGAPARVVKRYNLETKIWEKVY